ncbi:carbon-nitrogen family hydrolase [Virgibacillus sp. SK37]|uniref:carbon-nitrogen family hydrolase n=1 Tax=Virgibacillus sp. SK37 TaxID=403957 RepID=UPI0004D12CFA|nr:carbon-nitrogen family hydrolase [Virgibacillus sp. SK37]AIF44813.1 nitrilase/cyanide hydratase and apolipoprotein N-acyltransferase [Virgibacillus sp. SK37]
MKHAIYQMDIVPGDPRANKKKVAEWLGHTMREEKPDAVVLPEMWTTGYTLPDLEVVAETNGEPITEFLKKTAITYEVNIIGGSFANKKDGEFYNTSVTVDRSGDVVYRYDKIHLVPMLDEPRYLTGGKEKVQVFELDGVKAGLIICFDLRFPELTRSLSLEGAKIVYVVAEWPTARKNHWKSLLIARAIENQIYIVACNRVGEYNGVDFAGNSMVIDPWGNCLKTGSDTEVETIVETLDISAVAKFRKDVPIFSCRVPDLY